MRRRDLITLVSGAALAWMQRPRAASAQVPVALRRIGIILAGSVAPQIDGLLQGLRELGHVSGRDYLAEWRFAEGRFTRFPQFAQDFVRLKADVIFLGTAAAVDGVRQVTRSVPIVMGHSIDPVGHGFVASLTRPGGNVTGVAGSTEDTTPRQLEFLKEVVPNLSRIGVLLNPESSNYSDLLMKMQVAAGRAGLALVWVEASNPLGIDRAFTTFAGQRAAAVIVPEDTFFAAQQERLTQNALKQQLPSVYPQRDYVQAGGLMSYGESLRESYRRAASFVDRIFRGARPADLPIEQVAHQLVINRRTAAALGIAVPPHVYASADEVIE